MDKYTPEFTPEQVDAQVDQLLAHPFPASQNEHVVNDLQKMYQGDERSLNAVWQRLELENNQSDTLTKQLNMLNPTEISQQPTSTNRFNLERKHPVRQGGKRRAFSLLAAACVAALIVGGMLFISNLAHQNKPPTNIASNPHQDVYASDNNSVFKLDSQTHQTLWQQSFKDVIKIIPDGTSVYILQSSESGGTTDAVQQLDASNGKTLWTYTFSSATSSTNAFTRDMALAQNRLYVVWQTAGEMLNQGGSAGAAAIYGFQTLNGNKITEYPTIGNIWGIAAGAGVLVLNSNNSLHVYSLATNQLLWHVSFQASTNAPISSLQITNGLVYAAVIASSGENGQNLSSIRAYQATTGKLVWQSPTFASDALSSFTVNQHIIYFGTTLDPQPDQKKPVTGRIYAYNVQSNTLLWNTPVAGATFHQPIFNAGVVYVGIDSGPGDNTSPMHAQVVAINATTGTLKSQQTLAGDYIGGLCLAGGAIYASTYIISQETVTWKQSYVLNLPDMKTQQEIPYSFYVIAPAP